MNKRARRNRQVIINHIGKNKNATQADSRGHAGLAENRKISTDMSRTAGHREYGAEDTV